MQPWAQVGFIAGAGGAVLCRSPETERVPVAATHDPWRMRPVGMAG